MKPITYKDQVYELDKMSKDELLQLKAKIDESGREVKASLADARRKFITDGEPADRNWYRRAETAVRIYGQNSMAIQKVIAERNVFAATRANILGSAIDDSVR